MRTDDPGPYALDRLAAIGAPSFFSTSIDDWRRRLVGWFEAATGRTLYPAQVEMLLIDTLSYALAVMGAEAQVVVGEHLVAFASEAGLARLGVNRSCPRLPAAPAMARMQARLVAPRPVATVIPAGTRIAADGGPVFATLEEAVIPAGETSVDLLARATSAGAAGNGWALGRIATVLDPIAGVALVNVSPSEGGADIELVEAWRLRMANAFEKISTAGSRAWYRETVIGLSPAILDCAVLRPAPCIVHLVPLTADGAVGPALAATIAAAFDTDARLDIRFGDEVIVRTAVAVEAAAVLTVRVAPSFLGGTEARARAAAEVVFAAWQSRLGAVVAPSDVEAAVRRVAGVLDARLAGLAARRLDADEYLGAVELEVIVEGL